MERVTSGIAGLDAALRGGFLAGGIYMIMGRPGCGKTTLGNQLCFHHVQQGGRAIYVTLLAEAHARMLGHLESFTFFDAEKVGDSIVYVSGYNELERGKLDGLLELLRTSIKQRRASVLVLDGVPTAERMADSEIALKKFIHELQALVELLGCTAFLLTGANHPDAHYPERTMVDGLVQLTMNHVGMRTVRELEVVKHRGSAQLGGRHVFEIGAGGVVVHPRLEAAVGEPSPVADEPGEALSWGVPALDEVSGGGVRAGSTTLVKGPPGIGKTLLGLTYLAEGLKRGEAVHYFGFHESPPRVIAKGERIGLSLADAQRRGTLVVDWTSKVELCADALADQLLASVRRRRPRRLVVDGLSAFVEALLYPERAGRFFRALTNELRALGVGVVFTTEARDLVGGGEADIPVSGLSAVVENIVYLRYVEVASSTHRLISVVKMGDHGYDASQRELTIGPRGVVVSPTAGSAETLLEGIVRTSARSPGLTTTGEGKRKGKGKGKGKGKAGAKARGKRRGSQG